MGTTSEIIRITGETVDKIHVSYDGVPEGVGLTLFRFYNTPEAVEKLFSHDTWAPVLEDDIDDIDWDDWGEEGMRGQPLAAFLAEYTGYPEDPLGLFVFAHDRWAFPHGFADLKTFIETGESPHRMTREYLIAEGVPERALDAPLEPSAPVTEIRGIFRIGEDGETTTISAANGVTWDVGAAAGFQASGTPQEWHDKEVRALAATMGSSFSTGDDKPSHWATLRKLELVQ